MPAAETLITKHRGKGVFVDTNLFVLLLVGWVNKERIRNFKRTQDFSVDRKGNIRRSHAISTASAFQAIRSGRCFSGGSL